MINYRLPITCPCILDQTPSNILRISKKLEPKDKFDELDKLNFIKLPMLVIPFCSNCNICF